MFTPLLEVWPIARFSSTRSQRPQTSNSSRHSTWDHNNDADMGLNCPFSVLCYCLDERKSNTTASYHTDNFFPMSWRRAQESKLILSWQQYCRRWVLGSLLTRHDLTSMHYWCSKTYFIFNEAKRTNYSPFSETLKEHGHLSDLICVVSSF
jgi:hypothetical protein